MLALAGAVESNAQGSIPVGTPFIEANAAKKMLRNRVVPRYPGQAKSARVQGTVRLAILVGTDGKVENLTVTSGPQMLRQTCVDAVRQWVYEPLLKNGLPTPFTTDVEIPFEIF